MIAYKTIVIDIDGELCGSKCNHRIMNNDSNFSFIDRF